MSGANPAEIKDNDANSQSHAGQALPYVMLFMPASSLNIIQDLTAANIDILDAPQGVRDSIMQGITMQPIPAETAEFIRRQVAIIASSSALNPVYSTVAAASQPAEVGISYLGQETIPTQTVRTSEVAIGSHVSSSSTVLHSKRKKITDDKLFFADIVFENPRDIQVYIARLNRKIGNVKRSFQIKKLKDSYVNLGFGYQKVNEAYQLTCGQLPGNTLGPLNRVFLEKIARSFINHTRKNAGVRGRKTEISELTNEIIDIINDTQKQLHQDQGTKTAVSVSMEMDDKDVNNNPDVRDPSIVLDEHYGDETEVSANRTKRKKNTRKPKAPKGTYKEILMIGKLYGGPEALALKGRLDRKFLDIKSKIDDPHYKSCIDFVSGVRASQEIFEQYYLVFKFNKVLDQKFAEDFSLCFIKDIIGSNVNNRITKESVVNFIKEWEKNNKKSAISESSSAQSARTNAVIDIPDAEMAMVTSSSLVSSASSVSAPMVVSSAKGPASASVAALVARRNSIINAGSATSSALDMVSVTDSDTESNTASDTESDSESMASVRSQGAFAMPLARPK